MHGLLLVAATAVGLRTPAALRGRPLTRRYTTTSDIAELRREIEVLEDDLLRDRWARATSHTATAGCDTIATLLGTTEQQAVSLLLDSGATTVEADACTFEDYRSALRHLKAHRGAYAAPAAAPVAQNAEDAAPPAWERAVAMSTYASPLAQSAPLLSVLCFSVKKVRAQKAADVVVDGRRQRPSAQRQATRATSHAALPRLQQVGQARD